ncbi:MAG: tRNA dihydrouridine(20/20a) synthase DusA [Gammaproteobacteria bacterium]|nr:tRNA dihydrouridine(20/20a) synthase DusA [Gammaproteobacteria bacterium]
MRKLSVTAHAHSSKPAKIGIPDDFSRKKIDRRISVAPMMDWTDRHCRYFLRGFSSGVLLYTEMLNARAIARGDRARLLAFDAEEHPLALQLGGNDPAELAAAARAGADAGYDEINLNCGCPSERVASGAFGACLMREPGRVAECVAAMRAAVGVPVTVKMRIGVSDSGAALSGAVARFDERDFESLCRFVEALRGAGCAVAIVHARKAVLGGLSPRENREIPPLRYDVVQRLKGSFPALPLVVNGGLRTADTVVAALAWCDGVMLGREAYHRPFVLAELQHALWGTPLPLRTALIERMQRYAARELARGERLAPIVRHMLGLYAGEPGAREYRRTLSEGARAVDADVGLLRQAVPGTVRPSA